jgi:hypothetical protein
MSDHQFTRRRLLAATATAATTAGMLGAATGSAAASACPRTPGYWANHDWPSSGRRQVNAKLPGVEFGSVTEGQAFLLAPPRGDKGHILAKHLTATILNFQGVPACDTDADFCPCIDTPVRDVDGDGEPDSVRETKRLAEDWLAAAAFPDPQRQWRAGGLDGEALKDLLDDFNNNRLVLPGCPCGPDGDRASSSGDDAEDDGGPPAGRAPPEKQSRGSRGKR